MGALVDFRSQRWRVQADDLIGGSCITPAADPRKPSEGAPSLGSFLTEEIAAHIVLLHNAWLETGEQQ